MRIVSLVPSITELLATLGLEEEVVGITKFCIHPGDWFRNKKRVGGTKNVHIDTVRALKPTLVIANREENVEAQVREINSFCEVLITDVTDFDGALQMIEIIGNKTGKLSQAEYLLNEINAAFSESKYSDLRNAIYLIWNEPMMTIGGDTFISSMMHKAGFYNVFANELRYPQLSDEQIANSNAEYLLLSSEPFPFSEKHLKEFLKRFPGKKVILVDGEMFSWYGSRMKKAAKYFAALNEKLFL